MKKNAGSVIGALASLAMFGTVGPPPVTAGGFWSATQPAIDRRERDLREKREIKARVKAAKAARAARATR